MASSIPRFSPQSFDNTVEPPETNTAQGAAAPRERRTLHQMEQELNEWAKYPAEGENRIDIKEKILAAYQNPPELLELKNIGTTDKTPNLPKCLEDLDCKIKCKFGCITNTGTFKYIPELEGVFLIEGTRICCSSEYRGQSLQSDNDCNSRAEYELMTISETGTFQYITELQRMELTNGTIKEHHEGYNFRYGDSTRSSPEFSHTRTGIFEYIPQLMRMEMTKGVQSGNRGNGRGIWQYIPELSSMRMVKGSDPWRIGTFQFIPTLGTMKLTKGRYEGDIFSWTGTWQYTKDYPRGMMFKGIRHPKCVNNSPRYNGDDDNRRSEGTFRPSKNSSNAWRLKEGVLTEPDGTRRLARNEYYYLFGKTRYLTIKKLSPVAPLEPAVKWTLPDSPSLEPDEELTWEIGGESTEPENTTLESQAGTSGSTSQDAPTVDQPSTSTPTTVAQPPASSSASPGVPLLVTASFAERHEDHTANGLHLAHVPQGEQVLSLKVLPPVLQNNPICAQFFGDYAQAMQQLYNKKTADALGYSNIEASPWSRIANAVLTTSGILGLSVCGRLLTNLSQLHNETEAANKANSMLGHFCMPHQFDALTNHLAVRLTQALEPQLGVLLSQPTQNTLNPLKQKVNEWMQSWQLKPIEHLSPFALLTAMVCMKLLRKTPSADRQTQLNDNYLTELTDHLMSRVLNLMNIEGATAGPSTLYTDSDDVWTDEPELLDVHEVHETPDSEPAESSRVQQLEGEVAELKGLMKQLLENGNAGGMAVAQTLRHMQGVGGEVYAPIAESSTAAYQYLHTRIDELNAQLAQVTTTVVQNNQTITALTAPQAEFDLKGMVTASAHYLRRFGVINYANIPVTVRLANGREVDLAKQLEVLHNKLPNASLKPYRPQVELKQLVFELETSVRERANLKTQPGQGILGAVVEQRTHAVRVHNHNQDVVKIASYYLRRFGLVNYPSGEAKVQWTGRPSEVSIASALAHIHQKQGNTARVPYNAQDLLEGLLMKLPNSPRKDSADIDLPGNTDLLIEIQTRMSSKRALQARPPVSLQNMAQPVQARQQLLGNNASTSSAAAAP